MARLVILYNVIPPLVEIRVTPSITEHQNYVATFFYDFVGSLITY